MVVLDFSSYHFLCCFGKFIHYIETLHIYYVQAPSIFC